MTSLAALRSDCHDHNLYGFSPARFLNGAPYNLPEQDGQNCYQPDGSAMERRTSFATIEDCKATIARASNAGIIRAIRGSTVHSAMTTSKTRMLSKTSGHGNQQASASLPYRTFENDRIGDACLCGLFALLGVTTLIFAGSARTRARPRP